MDARGAIQLNLDMAHFLTTTYLSDLTDAELFVRPIPGINHIAWQLGHVIVSNNRMINQTVTGSMPDLPAGFAEKYTKEASTSDNPADFHIKAEYLSLIDSQRTAILKALSAQTDLELDRPPPEAFRGYLKSVGDVFSLVGTHFTMHSGQWVVIRRHLGRPPLF